MARSCFQYSRLESSALYYSQRQRLGDITVAHKASWPTNTAHIARHGLNKLTRTKLHHAKRHARVSSEPATDAGHICTCAANDAIWHSMATCPTAFEGHCLLPRLLRHLKRSC